MSTGNRALLIAGLIVLLPVISFSSTNNKSEFSQLTISQLGNMPLAFTQNMGQWDKKIKFRADAGGATMWFASDGAYYQFTRTIPKDDAQLGPVDPMWASGRQTASSAPGVMGQEPKEYETMMIKANFVGANPNPVMSGFEMMEYKCNYFIGNDPNEWHTDVPNYTAVFYEQVYDGIDLKYYGNGKQMEYDFIVSPGADFSQIRIQYEGAESVTVNANGELVVETEWGEVVEQRPVVYQLQDGVRKAVEGEYLLVSDNSFGFELDSGYDPALPLVIDPVLVYSTYLGGSGGDSGRDIAVDASGAAYVTGWTNSFDFPTLHPYQETHQSDLYDAFVTKLSSSGDSLIYSTYLGGSSWDMAYGIAVDASGATYITGETASSDFPTLNPYQETFQGVYDVFVTKLSSSGNGLIYSTYLGGSNSERGTDIAVDAFGAAYITGWTSEYFPTLNPYQGLNRGGRDAFVTKLTSSGNNLAYSTYLGGSGYEHSYGIAVDVSGAAHITGRTESTDFPTFGALQTDQGDQDAFVVKIGETSDFDSDWIADEDDNCPNDYNPGQEDADGVSPGDACCCGHWTSGLTGNTDCDAEGKRNLADITRLIDYVYISKVALCCPGNGNIDGDVLNKINLADITKLIDHVYISKAETATCE